MSDERYEIRGKIGQGGVGAVYRAYDTQLRREVAIKRVLATEGEGDADAEHGPPRPQAIECDGLLAPIWQIPS